MALHDAVFCAIYIGLAESQGPGRAFEQTHMVRPVFFLP
jgi:hypothetical protein